MGWLVAALAVAAVAFFALKGLQASRRERAEAPERLEAARLAFARGELPAALRELSAAFVEAERYTAEEARVALATLELAEQVFGKRGADLREATEELRQALGAAAASPSGGEVVTDHTARFKRLLREAVQETEAP